MDETSGFYNLDTDGVTLLFGPNGVSGPGYDLWRDLKDTYTYPVNGWIWFDTRAEAAAHFGVPDAP